MNKIYYHSALDLFYYNKGFMNIIAKLFGNGLYILNIKVFLKDILLMLIVYFKISNKFMQKIQLFLLVLSSEFLKNFKTILQRIIQVLFYI